MHTTLLHGCVKWGLIVFPVDGFLMGNYTAKPSVHHRDALRAMLGVNKYFKNKIVYALAREFPLQEQIAKPSFGSSVVLINIPDW